MGSPDHTIDNPFKDVKQSKYYYDAVLWAYENNITSGTSSDTFGVGNPCTREQVVTFLYATYINCAHMPAYEGTVSFKDVKEGKWYYTPIAWAYNNGITSGTSSDTFGVGNTCTRGMIVTFLKKYDDTFGS